MSALDDDALDRLLGHYAAPPPAAGLAERIRAEATRVGREPYPPPAPAARPGGANRRRWARPRWWVGVASVNLALVGAAAASIEVAHHGLTRIAAIPAALFHRSSAPPKLHAAVAARPAGQVVPAAAAAIPPSVAAAPLAPSRPAAPSPAIAPSRGVMAARQAPTMSPVRHEAVRGAPHPAAVAHNPSLRETPRAGRQEASHARLAGGHAERPPEHVERPQREAAAAPDTRVDEAAKVREANLASGERARADQPGARSPSPAGDGGLTPNRPSQAEQWRQWRQQMQQWRQQRMQQPQQQRQPQQMHNKQPPRGNAAGKRPGKKGLFGRRKG